MLYHAAFGFASAWRAFLAEGRGEGLRAQMVMLGVATLLFFPLIGSVAWLVAGRPVRARPRPHERSATGFPEYDRPGRASAVDAETDEEFLRRCRERAEEQRRRAREQAQRQEEQPEEG